MLGRSAGCLDRTGLRSNRSVVDLAEGAPGPPVTDLQGQITERRHAIDELLVMDQI